MARTPAQRARFPLGLSVILAGSFALGCTEKRSPLPAVPTISADAPGALHAATQLKPGVWRYTTRGEVTRLPTAKQGMEIRHEALVAFYNKDGENVGMGSMPMDFPTLAPGVSLAGVEVGDKVAFDFDVDWATKDIWVVTRLVKLPKETPLSFEKAPNATSK